MIMKLFTRLAAALPILLLAACGTSGIKDAIDAQLRQYPETRVTDIYKNFCQDNLGPGHLIPDPGSAWDYLLSELREYREDLDSSRYAKPAARYTPVGELDSLIGEGHLIMHHSDVFNETYHPHYRIVARDIFEKELLKYL